MNGAVSENGNSRRENPGNLTNRQSASPEEWERRRARRLRGRRAFIMFRKLSTIAITAAIPTLVACGHAPAPLAPAPRTAAPEPPPLSISYRVLRGNEGGAVVLAGRTQVTPDHDARVVSAAARSPQAEDLELRARTRDDGAVVVDVTYEERTADGTRLQWRPAVRLAHGAAGRAEVSGDGWSRTIEMTLE
jgi:hypothetical protein